MDNVIKYLAVGILCLCVGFGLGYVCQPSPVVEIKAKLTPPFVEVIVNGKVYDANHLKVVPVPAPKKGWWGEEQPKGVSGKWIESKGSCVGVVHGRDVGSFIGYWRNRETSHGCELAIAIQDEGVTIQKLKGDNQWQHIDMKTPEFIKLCESIIDRDDKPVSLDNTCPCGKECKCDNCKCLPHKAGCVFSSIGNWSSEFGYIPDLLQAEDKPKNPNTDQASLFSGILKELLAWVEPRYDSAAKALAERERLFGEKCQWIGVAAVVALLLLVIPMWSLAISQARIAGK